MKKILLASAVAALGLAAAPASATTLTFDGLTSACGNAGSCGLTGNSNQIVYSEAGYQLTFNSPSGGAHIADGTGTNGTYNWHDGGANIVGTTLTLTKVGGGLFDLLSFDYRAFGNLTVAAPSYASLVLNSGTAATSSPSFLNVASVTFSGPGSYELDNVQISTNGAVPEPATWAMMLVGFGLIGGAMRSRRQQQANVRFAM